MIYKINFDGSHIKYGYSSDFNIRERSYRTHAGGMITEIVQFPQEKDRIDELAIKEYFTSICHLTPIGGSSEIFENPGDLSIIDKDLTLETFYRYLNKIEFLPSRGGKLSELLKERLLALYKLFKYDENSYINEEVVRIMANLIESLYLNKNINLEDNIFIRAKVDKKYMDDLLSINLTCRDILDCWFKWDWEKIK